MNAVNQSAAPGSPLARVKTRRPVVALLTLVATLNLAACLDSTSPSSGDPCNTFQNMTFGATVAGTLNSNDCTLNDNTYADRFRFTLNASTDVQINLLSNSFQPFVILRTTNGTTLDTSSDIGGGQGAQISATLGAGTYDVIVNSVVGSQVGSYQLRVAAIEPL